MKMKSAEFVVSSADYHQCPKPNKPEYALIGRSNVGKSSLINRLTNRKHLAKTSGTPGKTQLINHFEINQSWYLVDLPGYGWAQTSKVNKAKWEKMNREYILHRENLYNLFILIDARIPPKAIDLDFIAWVGEQQIPLSVVFTKADQPKQSKIQANIAVFKTQLKQRWETLPPIFITSAQKKIGHQEILDYIAEANAKP